jgi:hypothetical protein
MAELLDDPSGTFNRVLSDLLAPSHSLIPPGLRERAGYGLFLYVAMALIGLTMLGKPHWGVLVAAVAAVPWLMLSYPIIFGGLLPLGLFILFRRYGWRHVFAFGALGALFVAVLVGRIAANGFTFGLAFLDAIRITFWIAILFVLFLFLLRMTLGRDRLGYITGHGWNAEQARIGRRQEIKAIKTRGGSWVRRAGQRVKAGAPYQGSHAKPKDGRVNPATYDPDVAGYDVTEGATRPETFDPFDDGTLVDGVPINEHDQRPRRFWGGGQ